MKDISKVRDKLTELRSIYNKRHDALKKDLEHEENPVEKDFAEQATQMENEQVLEALDIDAKAIIIQIDSALLRIQENCYGICTKCGEVISDNRLEAIPYASLCINCAAEQDG